MSMQHCLNPRKSHENSVLAQSEDATVALPNYANGQALTRQVACQYCRYLLEGALLGDCRVIKWIGSGAFGDVYEAEQLPPLNRRVAVKVMGLERVFDESSAQL